MKKYRRILPSMDAIVFFEASARHNSFTAAASELSVTQAAVSKRIKELESRLGVALFHRRGRTLTLTEAGRRLFDRAGMALEYLEDAVLSEMNPGQESVQIAANTAISVFWLAPRLRDFGLGPGAAPARTITSDRLRDQLDPDNDLAITYGHGEIPGWDSVRLFHEALLPMAHPDYLARHGIQRDQPLGRIGELAGCLLLEYDRIAPDWVNWRVWIERSGHSALIETPRRACGTYAHAIGQAISGQGIALGSLGLIDRELSAGHLVTIGTEGLKTGRGYFLSQPSRKKLSVPAISLRHALLTGV